MARCESTSDVGRCTLRAGHEGNHSWRGIRWRDPEPDALVEKATALVKRLRVKKWLPIYIGATPTDEPEEGEDD